MAYAQYGIEVTKNKFELFGDEDEDPNEVLKKREQEKEVRKKTKVVEKDTKPKETVVTKAKPAPRKGIKDLQNVRPTPEPAKPKEEENRKRIINRDHERKFGNENREERIDQRREDKPFNDFKKDNGDKPNRREGGGRGGGRGGRGGFRGGRDARPNFEPRNRDFDRQPATEKPDNKDTSENWDESTPTEPPQPEPEAPQDNLDKSADSNESPSGPPAVENGEATENKESEPVEMTLDEWKALRRPRQKPEFNIRKAGEGEDLTQWKKMYALQKKKEEENEEDDEYEYEVCEYPQRVGRQKHLLGIDIHFKDNRTGRGRGKGFGGRGQHPQNNSHPDHARPVPNVLDEHDFPSFGSQYLG